MLDVQLVMKSTKNVLIAILAGLLVLSLTSQPSQGADSPVTRAEFDALKNKLIIAQSNLDQYIRNQNNQNNQNNQKYSELNVMVASYDRYGKKSYEGCRPPQKIGSVNLGAEGFALDICHLKLLVLP